MTVSDKMGSLRDRLLLPLLLSSLLVGGIGVLVLQHYFSSSLQVAQQKQIETMAESLNLVGESASSLEQLQRYSSVLAAQRDVNLVMMVLSESNQVLTSNKHALLDSFLAKDMLPEQVRAVISGSGELFYYDKSTVSYWLVRNVSLVNLEQVSTLGAAKLVIQVNGRHLKHDLLMGRMALIGWLCVLLAALITVFLYVIKFRVLQRTEAINQTLQQRKTGVREARASVGYLDELGVIAESLNQMLDQQDKFDEVLAISNDAISRSEQRYRSIVETTQEGVWILDAQHRISYANNRMADMLEMPHEKLFDQNITNFISERFRSAALRRLEQAENSDVQRYDVALVTQGGREIWVTCSSTPLFDDAMRYKGMLGMVVDITERIATEQKLKDNQQKLEEIFSHSTDTIFVVRVGEKDRYVFEDVNQMFETNNGISRDFAIGRSPQELFAPELASTFLADFHKVVSLREPLEVDHDFSFGDNSRYLNCLLVPIVNDDGKVYRIYGFSRDITARREAEARVLYLAHHDTLTGLPNRTLMRDRLDQALIRAQADHNFVAMMFLDLDRFKAINDSFGHSVGDAFLKEVSLRLLRCVRSVDTVSRQGGDEFLLVLPDLTTVDEVVVIAKSILSCLDEPFEVEGYTVVTSFSIGISIYPTDAKTASGLLRNADTALMHAKQSGRNTYRFYTETMNVNTIERLQLEAELRKAFNRNEFSLHYQPQVDLVTGDLIGAEALVRWTHATFGNISPGRFIPVAEDCGLIVQLGDWVLNEAVRQNVAWQRQGYKPLTIAVNISAVQFKREDLVGLVKMVLARYGMDPRYLELELTESILLEDVGHTLETVLKLKKLGVQLSIDDFGTGYSSLSYLKRFSVEKLKIDQSFVRDLATDPEDEAIVRAIIQLGKSLQLKTIAEGVETQAQLDFLGREGCDEVQGYFFCRPVPAESFETILREGLATPRCAI